MRSDIEEEKYICDCGCEIKWSKEYEESEV